MLIQPRAAICNKFVFLSQVLKLFQTTRLASDLTYCDYSSVVCLSVCMYVCHVRVSCSNG